MKRLFSNHFFMRASVMLLMTMLMSVRAWSTPISGSSLTYELSGGTLTISGTGSMPDYTSDSPAPWYGSRASITSIVIGNGVTSIGEYAFINCGNVTSVTFEASSQVATIGERAFNQCIKLSSITLPASLVSIGEYAFLTCSIIETIDMSGCSNLTTIGTGAFAYCAKMASITIPARVTTFGDNPFLGCNALTAINVDAGNANYASEGGIMYNKTKTTIVMVPKAMGGAVVLPSTISSMANSAFSGTNITSIDMSACTSLTTIGNSAFATCTSLTSVTLRTSVTVIGQQAFEGCSSLSSINLNECTGLTEIGAYAFSACGALAGSFTLPTTLTSIGNGAFQDCATLTQLTINAASLTTYGNSAFDRCAATFKLVLPDAMTIAIMAADSHDWKKYVPIIPLPSGYTGVTYSRNSHVLEATLDGSGSTTVAIPTDVKVWKVYLPRTFNEDQVSTWMMPFPSQANTYSLTFYTFTGVAYNNTTNKWEATMTQLSPGDAVAANTPYIVKAGNYYEIYNESGSQNNFTLNTTTNSKQTTVGSWTFKGVYTQKTWTAGDVGKDYGFAATSGTGVSAGDFVKLAAGASCAPMRCYLTFNGSVAPWESSARGITRAETTELPQTISVVLKNVDGSATEIGTITPTFTEGEQVWYSLDGMRLNEKPATKGVFINQGKKVVVK